MSTDTVFWLAIDDDGDETIWREKPDIDKERGFYWSNWQRPVDLPKGQIAAWGYKVKPGECIECVGPNYDPPRDIPQQ